MHYANLATPIGRLMIVGDDAAVRHILFPNRPNEPEPGWIAMNSGPVAECAQQLREYFAGTRREFDLPLAPQGTPFQREVWRALQQIPFGETISYGELAKRVGKPKAARAVGSANGANRISIVIPCHRVIASGGALGGFGGGLETKQWLLDWESSHSADAPQRNLWASQAAGNGGSGV